MLKRSLYYKLFDVVIIDSEMSTPDGLNLISIIGDRFSQIKILVLSNNYERQHIVHSIPMGARAYLPNGTPPRELANAIRSLNWGYFQLGLDLLKKLAINNHHPNFLEYISGYKDNKLSILLKEFKT